MITIESVEISKHVNTRLSVQCIGPNHMSEKLHCTSHNVKLATCKASSNTGQILLLFLRNKQMLTIIGHTSKVYTGH